MNAVEVQAQLLDELEEPIAKIKRNLRAARLLQVDMGKRVSGFDSALRIQYNMEEIVKLLREDMEME